MDLGSLSSQAESFGLDRRYRSSKVWPSGAMEAMVPPLDQANPLADRLDRFAKNMGDNKDSKKPTGSNPDRVVHRVVVEGACWAGERGEIGDRYLRRDRRRCSNQPA